MEFNSLTTRDCKRLKLLLIQRKHESHPEALGKAKENRRIKLFIGEIESRNLIPQQLDGAKEKHKIETINVMRGMKSGTQTTRRDKRELKDRF